MFMEMSNIKSCNTFLKELDSSKLLLKLFLNGMHLSSDTWRDVDASFTYDCLLGVDFKISLSDGILLTLRPEGDNTVAKISIASVTKPVLFHGYTGRDQLKNSMTVGSDLSIDVSIKSTSVFSGTAAFDCIIHKQAALLHLISADIAVALIEMGIIEHLAKLEAS
ncbi:hypothetical protein [Photobacterium kishitanii]|uniref:Uncharacterized protein n=1 Tax=Photobacterium kishitanii TaxID=318456 RepID=A0A2T3KL78_9GAMM|nr:hypothetical protein [Photobacterium kishitanii]PSV00474.1 hypothetical protein C9J27_04900 [Photobacterium kishitanii]